MGVNHINERIEAWFELCQHDGLSGKHAVVIPRANRVELMLHPTLINACSNDTFKVYAIDSAVQAAELLTGVRAGTAKSGEFPQDSLLGRVRSGLSYNQ